MISPVRAGVAPSECCSKVASKRPTAPPASYTAWMTVNLPVSVFEPRPSPLTSSPGTLNELWTNPDKFDPDRFAEPRSEHKKHRYAFAPFGGGAHKCIGMVFGQLEIKTVMHRLLRKYRLELTHPGYRPRYDYGGMPVPLDGMPIVLRPLR